MLEAPLAVLEGNAGAVVDGVGFPTGVDDPDGRGEAEADGWDT